MEKNGFKIFVIRGSWTYVYSLLTATDNGEDVEDNSAAESKVNIQENRCQERHNPHKLGVKVRQYLGQGQTILRSRSDNTEVKVRQYWGQGQTILRSRSDNT